MIRYLLIPMLAASLLGASGWSSSTRVMNFPSTSITTIKVITTNGAIHVTSAATNAIAVTEIRNAPVGELQRWSTQTTRKGSTLVVHAHYNGRFCWSCGGIAYTIAAPSRIAVTLQSSNGRIEVQKMSSDIRAETTNGNITVRDGHANAWLTTTNGSVHVSLAPNANSTHISMDSTNGGLSIHLAGRRLAQLGADTTNGSVDNNFGLKTGKSVHLTWPSSGLNLQMDTTNGGISIQK